jgi:hypothetical protein
MEFGCSICRYTSSHKQNVITHINRKKSCGIGVKEIIEIPIKINCEYCNKNFASLTNLTRHIKNNCKEKDRIKDEEIKKLKDHVKELEKKQSTTNITNNYKTYNVIINNYLDTKTDHLSDKSYNKLLTSTDAHQIIPQLIKQIHFDQNIPENHNIYISNRNKNNKYMQIYNDDHWETANKETEIDNLINDKETNLSDWIDEKGEKYPNAVEKFNEYLEQKYDSDTAKLVKEEVELLLYNCRTMIKV